MMECVWDENRQVDVFVKADKKREIEVERTKKEKKVKE